MLLRTLVVLVLLGSLISGVVAAPASFPGSKLVFEMTFTEKDFLPAIKQFIPAMPGVMSQVLGAKMSGGSEEQMKAITDAADMVAKNMVEALSGLQSVSMAGYGVKSADPDKIADFYLTKLGLTKGWSQTLRVTDPNGKGSVRLYVKPDLEETFGIFSDKSQLITFQTKGKIDVLKVTKTITDMIPLAIQIATTSNMNKMPVPEPAPPMVDTVPAPEPEAPTDEPQPAPTQ